jgi:ADP-heptose:LPS heptosyltransferase
MHSDILMSFKKTLRCIRLFLGKLLLDKKNKTKLIHHPQRILFMRQDGKLGDYIVSSFAYREIKKFNPDAYIGVVCTHKDAYLYESNPHIDELYFVRNKHIGDYIRVGMEISKQRYDVVIDPTEVLRNRNLFFLRLINASSYIGYQKSTYRMFSYSVEEVQHYARLYTKALKQLNIPVQSSVYDIPKNLEAESEIELFLQEHRIQNYIAINFYGAASSRMMNPENIKKYIKYIRKQTGGRAIVLLSYPAVYSELQGIAQLFDDVYVHNTKHIFHTIALIRHCILLISIDTSTVHIGSGFNKKIIAWYRSEKKNYEQWGPTSQAETHIIFYEKTINELVPEAIEPAWLMLDINEE